MLNIDSDALPSAKSAFQRAAARRTKSRSDALAISQNTSAIPSFPQWAKLGVGVQDDAVNAHFYAGASLALLGQILHSGDDVSSAGARATDGLRVGLSYGEPVFAGALRQRLALRAATACAAMLRLREDEAALRDREHLAVSADPGPAGRLHRLWRALARAEPRLDAKCLAEAMHWLDLAPADLPPADDVNGLVDALRALTKTMSDPIALAAQASRFVYALNPCPAQEILALWIADLMLASRLRFKRVTPLLITKILDPSLRRGLKGSRARPNAADWPQTVARAYALAAQDAHGLGVDLARRADKLLGLAPKLRAKGAERVLDLLLADDCVTPAHAAKLAGLSDRAARRLFDRLVDLDGLREVSGRSTFRLYGL